MRDVETFNTYETMNDFRPSVRLFVVRPLTPVSRDAISLYLVEGF